MTETKDLEEMLDEEPLAETIDKQGLMEKQLEILFHKVVKAFKDRWHEKGTDISPAGMYNYAMSMMAYEFHNKFSKEKSQELIEQYNPNK